MDPSALANDHDFAFVDEVLERLFRAADVGCGLFYREEAIHRSAVPTLKLRVMRAAISVAKAVTNRSSNMRSFLDPSASILHPMYRCNKLHYCICNTAMISLR